MKLCPFLIGPRASSARHLRIILLLKWHVCVCDVMVLLISELDYVTPWTMDGIPAAKFDFWECIDGYVLLRDRECHDSVKRPLQRIKHFTLFTFGAMINT